jgi:hypothetical protein
MRIKMLALLAGLAIVSFAAAARAENQPAVEPGEEESGDEGITQDQLDAITGDSPPNTDNDPPEAGGPEPPDPPESERPVASEPAEAPERQDRGD